MTIIMPLLPQEIGETDMTLSTADATALRVIVPLEDHIVAPHISGADGTNRARSGHPQIAADTDIDAINAWLARFADTRTTFENYRKEAERLVLWSLIERRQPISSLTHEDLLRYQRFLTDPQPSARWVMAVKRKPGRRDPAWRPFAGPLSPTSQRQALVILNAMFAWLVTAGYLAGNPLSLSRQRARSAKPRITRYIETDLWAEVKAAIAAMPQNAGRECAHYARVRWLFSLLYLCGLRLSEVVENTMGGFSSRRDRDGTERWWLEIVGKGNKKRLVPATNELMAELARYRRAMDLSAFPVASETIPLLLPIGERRKRLTRAAVHRIVKQVFQNAAERLRARGGPAAAKAERLARASAHWLRHTAGSAMADQALDLRFVRDNLGHESLTTTSGYLHAEDDERHRQTEQKHRIDW